MILVDSAHKKDTPTGVYRLEVQPLGALILYREFTNPTMAMPFDLLWYTWRDWAEFFDMVARYGIGVYEGVSAFHVSAFTTEAPEAPAAEV